MLNRPTFGGHITGALPLFLSPCLIFIIFAPFLPSLREVEILRTGQRNEEVFFQKEKDG